jgi:DNA-binding MarR family transcriptional regulator
MKSIGNFSSLFLEKQICFPLYAASRLTTKFYEPFLTELDITYPQYLVLLVLWQNNHLTVNEIGNRLFLESNTLTPLLKRLEQKNVIQRKRSDEDERKVIISLTKEGEILKEKAVMIPEKLIQNLSNHTISVNEIISFQNTLNKLISVLNNNTTTENNLANTGVQCLG